MIEVTEAAHKKIEEYVKENDSELAVRVFLAQGG